MLLALPPALARCCRRLPPAVACAALLGHAQPVRAEEPAAPGSASAAAFSVSPATLRAARGRPQVKLDRLTLPDIEDASYYRKHLRRSLEREARLADWGADSGAVIEYRFRVDALRFETEQGVLRVHCAATGELPGRKNATSRLAFSGSPKQRRELARRVLEIVARGVITRLAQIEHARRNP